MRSLSILGVLAIATAVLAGAAAGDSALAAKRGKVPLPDANPKRIARTQKASPGTAEKAVKKKNAPRFNAKALLKPVLGFKLSKADRENLKTSINHVYKRRYGEARTFRKRIKDEHARKLALWYFYRSRGLDANGEDIEAFRLANPTWPNQKRLRQNAERSLFINRADAARVETFFEKTKPQTGAGKAALASMHLAKGNKEKAKSLIVEAWREPYLTKQVEEAIAARYAAFLGAEEHKARVDRLLYKDRKSRLAAAQRTAKKLPKNEQKKIEARVAVVKRSKTAGKLLDAIPDEQAENDIGFYFSNIQWHRRKDRDAEAWRLLKAAPSEPEKLLDLDEWWIERRINCRNALNAGQPAIAYEIASNHGPLKGRSYLEAQFLSGWIALRFLQKPDVAQQHFLALRTAATAPRRIARAEYWLGRTAAVAGDNALAKTHYDNAAKHNFTYYGQIARQTLSQAPADTLAVPAAPAPTKQDAERFAQRDAVRAIAAARSAGLEKLAPLFFHQLARTLTVPAEIVLLAEFGRLAQQPHASVRLGKIALNRGHPVADYAYPVGLLPNYKVINKAVEPGLLHALSRQESEFNPKAKSPVGARGLMQLMPGTARLVARQFKVRYNKSKLTGSPSYNMMLGVAHLADLIDSYQGSYILTLVAYNAGPGRVRDWTEQFGDPRDPNVDAIDWVERIPFTETRQYVKKILTGMQIFRARIDGPENALRIIKDLNRYDPSDEPIKNAATAIEAGAATVESQ